MIFRMVAERTNIHEESEVRILFSAKIPIRTYTLNIYSKIINLFDKNITFLITSLMNVWYSSSMASAIDASSRLPTPRHLLSKIAKNVFSLNEPMVELKLSQSE